MQVGVIEADGGIRCIVCSFLHEEGHETKDYREIPATYEGIDVVIFGPNCPASDEHKLILQELRIPHIQLDHFADMDEMVALIATFARMEQCIVEDRPV